eukprot:6195047-Pleurochrysis_carterae.AAC.1
MANVKYSTRAMLQDERGCRQDVCKRRYLPTIDRRLGSTFADASMDRASTGHDRSYVDDKSFFDPRGARA